MSQSIEKAVQAWQVYLGSDGTVGVKTAQRLYQSAIRKTERIAADKGMSIQNVTDQLCNEARKRGPITPVPGKHY